MAERISIPARSLSALVGTTVGRSDWITVDQTLIADWLGLRHLDGAAP